VRGVTPDAFVLRYLQAIGIPRGHERTASLNRGRDVLVIIRVGADAGPLMLAWTRMSLNQSSGSVFDRAAFRTFG
jgi:hypothetical protein